MMQRAAASRITLAEDLEELGVRPGDLVMVHASLKALGPVHGGPSAVVGGVLEAIGPEGTLMALVSWNKSPYEETLNGREMSVADKAGWPVFDPATAGTERAFGVLNEFIVATPGARRSAHPDSSMAAIGPMAGTLVDPHPLDSAYGPGSPIERFIEAGGMVLLLGAPLDAVTVLHYAEAVADIPGKRRISYEMPVLDAQGRKVWVRAENWDSNGILDCFTTGMDGVETMARAYVQRGRHAEGRVAGAHCHLFDAQDMVSFGKRFLEENYGGDDMLPPTG